MIKGNRIQSQPRGLSRRGYSTQIQISAPIEAEPDIPAPVVEEVTSPAFSPETVILSTGEYVLKSEFDKLSPAQQSQLKTQGIALFNLSQDRASAASVIQLNTGEFLAKDTFDVLTPEDKSLIMNVGVSQYNAIKGSQAAQAYEAEAANYVQLQTGEYIAKTDYDNFSLADQYLLKASGIEGFNQIKQQEFAQANVEVRPGEYINRVFYESLPPNEQGFIRTQGVEAYNAGKQAEYDQSQALFNRSIQWTEVDGEGNRIFNIVDAIDKGKFTIAEIHSLLRGNGVTDEQIDEKIRAAYNQEPGFNAIVIPPEQQFAQLQEQGLIPASAVFDRIEAGQIYYSIPEVREVTPTALEPYRTNEGEYNIAAYIQDKGVDEITISTLKSAGYSAPAINAAITLAPYITDSEGGYDIAAYIQDNGVNVGTIGVLQNIGFSAPVINQAVEQATAVAALRPYDGNIVQFLRDNPNDVQSLTALGYRQQDIEKAVEAAKLAPDYNDYVSTYLAQQGITQSEIQGAEASQFRNLAGIASTISYDYRFPQESQADYEARAKVEQAKSAAYKEYLERYGGSALAQSIGAMYLSPVFAPARALRPDVEAGDITASEWVLGGGQLVALAAIPFGGGLIGKAAQVGASGLFGASTAMDWNKLTTTGKVIGTVGTIAFAVLPFADDVIARLQLSRSIKSNPYLTKLMGKAEAAGKATKAFDELMLATPETGVTQSLLSTAGKSQAIINDAKITSRALAREMEALAPGARELGLTNRQVDLLLAKLERQSGIVGLKSSYKSLSSSAKAVNKAWDAVEAAEARLKTLKQGTPDYTTYRDVYEEAYLRSLDKAQTALKQLKTASGNTSDLIARTYREADGLLPGISDDYASGFVTESQRISGDRVAAARKLIGGDKGGKRAAFDQRLYPAIGEGRQARLATIEKIEKLGTGEDIYLQTGRGVEERIVIKGELVDVTGETPRALAATKESGGIGGTSKPKEATPSSPEIQRMQSIESLKASINYYNKSGVQPLRGTVADLERKLETLTKMEVGTYSAPVDMYAGLGMAIEPIPVRIVTPLYVVSPVLAGVTVAALSSKVNASPEAMLGLRTLTQSEIESLAEYVGLSEGQIQDMSATNLAQAVAVQAGQVLTADEAQVITSAIVTTYPDIATEVAITPKVVEWIQAGTMEATTPEIWQATNIYPDDQIKPDISIQPKILQEPATQTKTDVIVRTPPPPVYPPPPVIEPPPIDPLAGRFIRPPKSKRRSAEEEEERAKFNGAFAFKHGFGWVALKKPYYREEDIKFFRIPPPGIIDVTGGKGAAYRSIQQYLEDNDLPDIRIKRGIMKITITKERTKEPGASGAIKFETTQRGRVKPEFDLDEWLEKSEDVTPPDVSAPYQQERKSDNTAPGFRVKIDDKMAW